MCTYFKQKIQIEDKTRASPLMGLVGRSILSFYGLQLLFLMPDKSYAESYVVQQLPTA